MDHLMKKGAIDKTPIRKKVFCNDDGDIAYIEWQPDPVLSVVYLSVVFGGTFDKQRRLGKFAAEIIPIEFVIDRPKVVNPFTHMRFR